MARVKKATAKRRKSSRTRGWFSAHIKRILVFLLLSSFLAVSLVTVSYVIFFRTVFAQDVITSKGDKIYFEEPYPPEHEEPPVALEDGTSGIDVSKELQPYILPKVAIIIDDMGYHEELGRRLVDLPIELTYSFLPFAPYSKILEQYAHFQNKTILLHLPLEPKGKHWHPGPGALYLKDSAEEQIAKFKACLLQIRNAVGVNNHMGSNFSEDEPAMRRILEQIRQLSLTFIDSYTTADSVGLKIARELGIKSARRHVFLDNILDRNTICEQLDRLVCVAEEQGAAIGIGHPHEVTYEAIVNCSLQYTGRIEYVDVSAVVH